MFGLEGCGFVLSISVTFLLVGLVVYLFKKQLKTLEQKFTSIFQLSQTLATSVDTLRQNCTNVGNNNTSQPSDSTDTRPAVIISDSESESDTDSDSEADTMCPFPNVKIVDIEKEPLKEHLLQVFNFNNSEMDKVLDVTDILPDDTSIEPNKTKPNADTRIHVTDMNDESDDESDDESGYDIDKDKPGTPNYSGMKVIDLRKLVQQKNITSDLSLKSLKKQELINLLKKND
jgi:hypothetical protein